MKAEHDNKQKQKQVKKWHTKGKIKSGLDMMQNNTISKRGNYDMYLAMKYFFKDLLNNDRLLHERMSLGIVFQIRGNWWRKEFWTKFVFTAHKWKLSLFRVL